MSGVLSCLNLFSPNRTIRITRGNNGIGIDVAITINDLISKGSTMDRPLSPNEGDLYYNTDTHNFEYWDGIIWAQFGSSVPTTNNNLILSLSGDNLILSTSGDNLNII